VDDSLNGNTLDSNNDSSNNSDNSQANQSGSGSAANNGSTASTDNSNNSDNSSSSSSEQSASANNGSTASTDNSTNNSADNKGIVANDTAAVTAVNDSFNNNDLSDNSLEYTDSFNTTVDSSVHVDNNNPNGFEFEIEESAFAGAKGIMAVNQAVSSQINSTVGVSVGTVNFNDAP
jgi:hypothetical protein